MLRLMVLVVVAGCGMITVEARANLLTNGGAETGDLSGWTVGGPVFAATSVDQSPGMVYPYQGGYFFSFHGYPASAGYMVQSGTTGLIAGQSLRLSGEIHTEPLGGDTCDYGDASIRFYDVNNSLLTQYNSGSLRTPNTWQPFELTADIPNGAISWQVQMDGTLGYGTYVDVAYDSLSLETIPEPATLSLLGLGLAGLIARRKRK